MKKFWLSIIGIFCLSSIAIADNQNKIKLTIDSCGVQPFLLYGYGSDTHKLSARQFPYDNNDTITKDNEQTWYTGVYDFDNSCKSFVEMQSEKMLNYVKIIGLFDFRSYSISGVEAMGALKLITDDIEETFGVEGSAAEKQQYVNNILACKEQPQSSGVMTAQDLYKCVIDKLKESGRSDT